MIGILFFILPYIITPFLYRAVIRQNSEFEIDKDCIWGFVIFYFMPGFNWILIIIGIFIFLSTWEQVDKLINWLNGK